MKQPEYEKMWHRDLKRLCRARGIPNNNALKDQMIKRLYEFDNDPANLTHTNPYLQKLAKLVQKKKQK